MQFLSRLLHLDKPHHRSSIAATTTGLQTVAVDSEVRHQELYERGTMAVAKSPSRQVPQIGRSV
jgi:hypothetical protein